MWEMLCFGILIYYNMWEILFLGIFIAYLGILRYILKAAEFNGQFTNVFTKSEYSQVPLLDRSTHFMEDIVVTKEGVTKLLKGLNPSKALGPDELHPRVLKELAAELGPFLRIYSSSQLTLVISLRSGHLQTLVPCSRRVIDHLLAIIVPFP